MVTTEDKILRAATTVFGKRGVSGATTREIALRAKVNEVTLFRLFKNKDELLRCVIQQSGKRFEDVFATAPLDSAKDLERTVTSYALAYAKKLTDNEEFVRTFMGELSRHLDLCRRLFAEGGKPTREKFIAYLRTAKRRGFVRSNLDVTMAADTLTAMILGGVMRRPLTAEQYHIDSYVKTCLKIYLKGLQP